MNPEQFLQQVGRHFGWAQGDEAVTNYRTAIIDGFAKGLLESVDLERALPILLRMPKEFRGALDYKRNFPLSTGQPFTDKFLRRVKNAGLGSSIYREAVAAAEEYSKTKKLPKSSNHIFQGWLIQSQKGEIK